VTAAGLALAGIAAMLGLFVLWSYIADASERRHPANPRYCREPRCLRLNGHAGAHVDDAGRSWP